MQRSNRTELCDATKNRKQSRFETHLGSDATKGFEIRREQTRRVKFIYNTDYS